MGRTAEDPVRMLKLQLLQFQYQLSDREVIRQTQVNLAFRLFLDLSLDIKLPVPSLLSQFRTRLREAHHKIVFAEVLRQAREQGLLKDRLRLKEATHIIANIAIPSTIGLVAQTRERLLASARPYRPEPVAYEPAEAERIRLSTSELKDAERLLHRVEHLRRIVAWAEALKEELGPVPEEPDGDRKRFEEAVELAHKLLSEPDHPWVSNEGRCWETRGVSKRVQQLIATEAYENPARDLTQYLDNWEPLRVGLFAQQGVAEKPARDRVGYAAGAG